jgi:hypothetical protein
MWPLDPQEDVVTHSFAQADAIAAAAESLARFWRACAERKQIPEGFTSHTDVGQAAHELELAMRRAVEGRCWGD